MSGTAASGADADAEFSIRVTGAAPPPLPSSSKGNKRGGGSRKTQQQQQRRYQMRLRPSSSLDRLRRDVLALFDVPPSSADSYRVSFLGGFPPRELDQTGKGSVDELGVRPNESLIVKFALASEDGTVGGGGGDSNKSATKKEEAAAAASKGMPKSTDASDAALGRQKRAAAVAATANFADVIAAQDEAMKKEKRSRKNASSSARITKSGNVGGFGSVNRRIETTNAMPGSNGKKRKKPAKMEGTGYRLSDGQTFEGSPSRAGATSSGGRKMKHSVALESKDDIAETLLSSMSGSGGGKSGKFLRAVMRGAVDAQYAEARAAVRVAAVTRGDYSFEEVKGGTVVEGGGVVLGGRNEDAALEAAMRRTMYTVSYSKGIEGRGRYEERVEVIELLLLKEMLKLVYNNKKSEDDSDDERDGGDEDADVAGKESLRPVELARWSPRSFWSLVFHCNRNPAPSSVEDMLQSTLPTLDWSHLHRGGRKRQLSEKARDNLRQKREKNAQPVAKKRSRSNEEGGGEVSAAGESTVNVASERERRARAAMARLGNSEIGAQAAQSAASDRPTAPGQTDVDVEDDWKLVTPDEEDIDELVECIMEGAPEEGVSAGENYDEKTAKAWAGTLLESVNVRNWRGLANCKPDEVHSVLGAIGEKQVPSTDTIERWIDAAQARSLEEIMLEILDSDQDALDFLQERAKSSSPKDLSDMAATAAVAPDIWLDTMTTGMDEGSRNKWKGEDVKRWIRRANVALRVCPWLEAYTSN